jgi:hypothetical protein
MLRTFVPALYAFTIFVSAFLLFSLEPLIAKQILPWFGGSAAVWSTCLVFYQLVLLAGYFYATRVAMLSAFRRQAALHCVLLCLSLFFLPIGPGAQWKSIQLQHPIATMLAMLSASILLPFLALSATSPLLQHWLGASGHRTPHKLFAVSNFASLSALILYPLAIEPQLDMKAQRFAWSAAYVIFVAACAACSIASRGAAAFRTPALQQSTFGLKSKILCVALASCGSMLLLSLTNHLTENVAPVPLLWVLPLAVYLLTFILVFSSERIYRRALWLRFLAVGLGILGYEIYDINAVEAIQVSIPVCLGGLFVCCLFCHGELNLRRPGPDRLTDFYLMISLGGALGAVFVGLVSPAVFSGIYELPISLLTTAVLAVIVVWPSRDWPVRVLWLGAVAATGVLLYSNVWSYQKNTLALRRSFYGSLRVVQSPLAGERQTRTLFHGTIEHGAQFLLPPMRFRPTTYYGPDSGIGIVLRECFPSPMRVGVIGLGVGTVAAYGRTGDSFRFYEINSQVENMAKGLFFYLRESHANIGIVTGDARLSLEDETGPPFHVIAVDAFSGDAIPVHLITREALRLYLNHLQPDGVVAFHVSNNYLDLASVVKQLATEAGYGALLAHSHEDDDALTLPADWVIVTKNDSVLQNPSLKVHETAIADRKGMRPWTDDYNNLLQILRTPVLH